MSLANLEWGRGASRGRRRRLAGLVVDVPLFVLVLAIVGMGLVVLYSAGAAEMGIVARQGMRFAAGLASFFVLAQIPPHYLRILTP